MSQPSTVQNPFMLMLAPEAVLQAVERSRTLTALRRRTCRPLDRVSPGAHPEGHVLDIDGEGRTDPPEAAETA